MSDLPVLQKPMLPVKFWGSVGYRYLPTYQHRWLRVGAGHVEVDSINLRTYLKNPADLIADMDSAYAQAEKMLTGDANVRGRDLPYDFWFNIGHNVPLMNGRWEKVDRSDNYLTVLTRDLTTEGVDYVGRTVYIKLELHERMLREAQTNIAKIIGDKIERGIEKALRTQTATVDEIQRERQRLERQIEELEIAEQAAREREAAQATRKALPRSTAGYVYVLRQVGGTHYKIGHTSNPEKRKHTFDVKLPFAVEFDVLITTEDRYTLEKQLHAKYASKRVDGEWFNLDADDLDYLRQLAANE